MKTTFGLVLFGLFTVINALFIPFAEAHGTGHRVIRDGGTITVKSFYSDHEPMAYAKAMVYGPSDEKVEFQNGRTDRNGRFAFFPDEEGTWRIEVNDGMGHLMKADIDVTDSDSSGTRPGESVEKVGAMPADGARNTARSWPLMPKGNRPITRPAFPLNKNRLHAAGKSFRSGN